MIFFEAGAASGHELSPFMVGFTAKARRRIGGCQINDI